MNPRWEIIIVDDEEVMRESLAAWLKEDGYAVDTASSGREAVEKARNREFAIYFIDLKMPGGMDGIETMMEIRRIHPEASIIIITAYATVDTAITAMKEGAQEYIVKPCNPAEISMLVGRIILAGALGNLLNAFWLCFLHLLWEFGGLFFISFDFLYYGFISYIANFLAFLN